MFATGDGPAEDMAVEQPAGVRAAPDSARRAAAPCGGSDAAPPRGSDAVVVAVRIRPLSDAELRQGAQSVVRAISDSQLGVSEPGSSAPQGEKVFTFDRCFCSAPGLGAPEIADQGTVYDGIGRAVRAHALEGFNTCIFAYGQTGAGKTHTMMGAPDMDGADEGVVPRLCGDLFHRTEEMRAPDRLFKCEVSYFEIYSEKVRCLLSPRAPGAGEKNRVREHPVTGPYVEDLQRTEVASYADVRAVLHQGNQARTVAATRSNTHSSRSHAVFSLILTQSRLLDVETGRSTDLVSRVNLVDLAGSERLSPALADTDQMKEGITINKSLSTLGRVINALADRARKGQGAGGHVPYRESVLTWLLRENLGGNSKTVMLACISPASTQHEESLHTLRYADRVKCIHNEAVVNEDQERRLIRELRREIEVLRSRLGEGGAAPQGGVRRSSYSGKFPLQAHGRSADWCSAARETLDSSETIVAALEADHARKLEQNRQMYNNLIDDLRGQFEEGTLLAPGVRVTDDCPLLVSLDPNLCSGECIAWRIKEGETYVLPDEDPVTAESVADIRLHDSFNLSNPHCILDRHETGSVVITPLNGSLTYVDGILLTTPVLLAHRARLIFGSHHAFYFLDPAEARRERDERAAAAAAGDPPPPRILDWGYAGREFAETMECFCPASMVIGLRNEVEHWRRLAEGPEPTSGAPCLVLLEVAGRPAHEYVARAQPMPPLVYPLVCGRNDVSAESWDVPQLQRGATFEVDSGRVLQLLPGGPAAIGHGSRVTLGDCTVVVSCPLAPQPPPPPATRNATSPSGGRSREDSGHRRGSPPPSQGRRGSPQAQRSGSATPQSGRVHKGLHFAHEELDELRRTLHEFQFQMLEMRDVLYPPPPEDAGDEGAEPPWSPEEQELLDRRERLKDDSIVSAALYAPGQAAQEAARIVDWVRRVAQELRSLTHDFTFRLDHVAPPAFSMGKSQHAVPVAGRDVPKENLMRGRLAEQDEELTRLRAAQSRAAADLDRQERQLQQAQRRAAEAEREAAQCRRQLRELRHAQRAHSHHDPQPFSSLARFIAPAPNELHQQHQWRGDGARGDPLRRDAAPRRLPASPDASRDGPKAAWTDGPTPPGADATGSDHSSGDRARAPPPPVSRPRTTPADSLDGGGLTAALERAKQELLPISGCGVLPLFDSIQSEVQARGAQMLVRACALLRRAVAAAEDPSAPDTGGWRLTPAGIERLSAEQRLAVARSLREIVVCHDVTAVRCSPQTRQAFDELSRNARWLDVLAAAAARWERAELASQQRDQPRSPSPRPGAAHIPGPCAPPLRHPADAPPRQPPGRQAAARSSSAGARPSAVAVGCTSPVRRVPSLRSTQLSPRSGVSARAPSPQFAASVARAYGDNRSYSDPPPLRAVPPLPSAAAVGGRAVGAGRGLRRSGTAPRHTSRSPTAVHRTLTQSPTSQSRRCEGPTATVAIGGRNLALPPQARKAPPSRKDNPAPGAERPAAGRSWSSQAQLPRAQVDALDRVQYDSRHQRPWPCPPQSADALSGRRSPTPRAACESPRTQMASRLLHR